MYRYHCDYCNKDFERNYAKKPTKNGLTFCTRQCSGDYIKSQRNPYILVCQQCGKQKAVDNKWKVTNRKFCSNNCRYKHMKSFPDQYVTDQFVKEGRLAANSPVSIKKGLETKLQNGSIINWEDKPEWKKYWREVNRLTGLMRKKMLKEWDGYDYYTGKYIKHFLSLPITHKHYPTLDHVIPRSEGFKKGLTPKQITVKENLVWTTRSNNSKKGNKSN